MPGQVVKPEGRGASARHGAVVLFGACDTAWCGAGVMVMTFAMQQQGRV